MTEQLRRKLSDSPVARWTALLIVAFTMMMGYYITYQMSPLESLLESPVASGGMNWTSTEYGFFSGSYGFINVFLLMLFFGGLILDCLNRTENAMTQAHAFKAAELCLQTEEQAVKVSGLKE